MTYLQFSSPNDTDKFKEYLSSKNSNINFSIEKEKDCFLFFLDVNILRENEKFATNVTAIGLESTSTYFINK